MIDARGAAADRLSIQADLGTSILYDFELGGTDISFNVGNRLDVAAGFQLTRQFALELESGVIWNAFSKYGEKRLTGDHLQAPMLFQVAWRARPDSRFRPLLSLAAGGVYDYSTIDRFENVTISEREGGFSPAFQGGVGFEWAFHDDLSIGLIYKYLYVHTQEQFSIPGEGQVQSNGTKTQSVSVRLRYHF